MDEQSTTWRVVLPKRPDMATIIGFEESEYFDRKRQFHDNNAKLVHDILCLSNAYADSDRFLVFGRDDKGDVVGLAPDDPHRRTNAQLQDLLKSLHFNRLPTVQLSQHTFDGKSVAILHIRNRPDKPFFLRTDFVDGKVRVRAGVVFTRVGDTNTPIDGTAPDEQIELMWRERFGLNLSPLVRFGRLLDERDKWRQTNDDSYIYHADFPEFVIRQDEPDFDRDFVEPWSLKFPDPHASRYEVLFCHYGTVLRRSIFVSCDGGRYQVPLPYRKGTNTFTLYTDSLEYKLARIYRQRDPGTGLDSELAWVGITLVNGPAPMPEPDKFS